MKTKSLKTLKHPNSQFPMNFANHLLGTPKPNKNEEKEPKNLRRHLATSPP